jgi:hypothetical protein
MPAGALTSLAGGMEVMVRNALVPDGGIAKDQIPDAQVWLKAPGGADRHEGRGTRRRQLLEDYCRYWRADPELAHHADASAVLGNASTPWTFWPSPGWSPSASRTCL